MDVVLTRNAYGKSKVRLTKVARQTDRHDLVEWSVDLLLEGEFHPAYTTGDNRLIVATDTMKNTVYALARDHVLTAPENFAALLAEHFINRYPQVTTATIDIREQGWQRLLVGGKAHSHSFIGTGPERRVCRAIFGRDQCRLLGGIDGMLVLKTTDSAFRDFHRDEFRTLADAEDRILATEVTGEWLYTSTTVDANEVFALIRSTLLESFANHRSLGVQHTLHDMGKAVLTACGDIEEITLQMPNRHRLPVNLTPLQRDNPNEIFVATDEPHGLISGTLRRK